MPLSWWYFVIAATENKYIAILVIGAINNYNY